MWTRRAAMAMTACAACGPVRDAAFAAAPAGIDLGAIPRATHERFMRLAIAAARGNPRYPFGAVIVRAADGAVMASGVNHSTANPTFHGEIDAMNDYVQKHGNRAWQDMILYTTGESCPMCMSAMVWAGMGGSVFGTSIAELSRVGIAQIEIAAASVVAAAPSYHGTLLGGVLAPETDRIFAERERG